jgi:short-subunit dehydrogenase
VNIGSIAGRVTTPLMSPYCASKHAVEAITDALRLELKPWGVEVSVIEPGVVATPIWDKGTTHLQDRLGTMPAVALELYAPLIAAFRGVLRRAPGGAMSPDAVVRAVAHALHSPRPRTRYVVGRVARLRLLLQTILPRRWVDGIILRFLRREAAQAA